MTENFTYVDLSKLVPYYSLITLIFPIIIPLIMGGLGGFCSGLISFLQERKEKRKEYKDFLIGRYKHEFWIYTLVGAITAGLIAFQPSPIQGLISQYPAFYEFIIGFFAVAFFDKYGSNLLPGN